MQSTPCHISNEKKTSIDFQTFLTEISFLHQWQRKNIVNFSTIQIYMASTLSYNKQAQNLVDKYGINTFSNINGIENFGIETFFLKVHR